MTRYKDDPFAMIGVNSWKHEPGKLKAVMEKEKLPWRTFDGGEIFRRWARPPSPSFYVIDHRGIIRHQWLGNPGEKAIDSVLDHLIREAKKDPSP